MTQVVKSLLEGNGFAFYEQGRGYVWLKKDNLGAVHALRQSLKQPESCEWEMLNFSPSDDVAGSSVSVRQEAETASSKKLFESHPWITKRNVDQNVDCHAYTLLKSLGETAGVDSVICMPLARSQGSNAYSLHRALELCRTAGLTGMVAGSLWIPLEGV
jgi:hypothetical protein